MNLRSVDLNLLVILDALLEEAHVSRAADRLALSQPAVSAALQRCRNLFRDELLERGRGTMRPTPRAEALRAPLKSVLAEVLRLVDPAPVPLVELREVLRFSMADYPALLVIGPLQQALQRTAPGIDLIIKPWHGSQAAQAALLEGSTDLAISVFPEISEDLHRETLFDEHYLVAMRWGHPAAESFDLEQWLNYPHILVSGRGETRSPLDAQLSERGLRRRVGLVVPSFQMVPSLLRTSNMFAMLPSRCIPPEAGDLLVKEPPLPAAGFPLHLAWHRRRDSDAGLRHVAEILRQLVT